MHQLSVLEGCPAYRDLRYSKMTENGAQGPTPGVRLLEVSVKRELTVIVNVSKRRESGAPE